MGGAFDRYRPIDITRHIGKRPYAGKPEISYDFYIFPEDHRVPGSIIMRTLDDPINAGIPDRKRIVSQYRIGEQDHKIFTLEDVIKNKHSFNDGTANNLKGLMMERISRRVMEEFLTIYTPDGRHTGRFVGFSSEERKEDHHMFAWDDEHVLKTKAYPHAVLLKKRWNKSRTKEFFDHLTDLDGLFCWEYDGTEHTVIVESKVGNWGFDDEKKALLSNNLIAPMRAMLPTTVLDYVVFGVKEKTYYEHTLTKQQMQALPNSVNARIGPNRKVKRLTPQAVDIYNFMKRKGVNTMFFTFNEPYIKIAEAKEFLVSLYHQYQRQKGTQISRCVEGTLHETPERTEFFNGAEMPYVSFVLDPSTGQYDKITHGLDILSRVAEEELAEPKPATPGL